MIGSIGRVDSSGGKKSKTGRAGKSRPETKKSRSARRKGERRGQAKKGARGIETVAKVGKRRAAGEGGRESEPQGTTRGALVRLFADLKKEDGCGAMLVVAEGAGAEPEVASRACRIGLSLKECGRGAKAGAAGRGAKGARPGARARARRTVRVSSRTCRVLAAVGHEQRVRLLSKLLEGPATYRALQRVTKLKAGPLYHHINQLRLAGLILPKQRDLYELTRGGRNLILAVMVIGPLIRDLRRRPQPSG